MELTCQRASSIGFWCKARELQNGQLEHRPASEIAGAVAGAIETWVFAWELAGVAKGQATVGRRELGLRENQEREAGPGLVVSRKSGPAHEGWLHGSVLALPEGECHNWPGPVGEPTWPEPWVVMMGLQK